MKEIKLRKRLVLGDIHGHLDTAKTVYERENPDDVIILGDYFDSFHGTDKEILDCFKTLLEMKRSHEKSGRGLFTLLIGNHDFQYIDMSERYSGRRKSYEIEAHVLLTDNLEHGNLQWYVIDDVNKTVYSHAGIMNAWLSENRLFINDLHDLENIDMSKYKFTHRGGDSGYGDGPFASPIWVRPSTLVFDMYKDNSGWTWTQIVGHTNRNMASIYCGHGLDINRGEHDYEYEQDPEGLFQQYNTNGWPMLYVIDSMPYYYIIELIDDDTKRVIKRTVKRNEDYPLLERNKPLSKAEEDYLKHFKDLLGL